MAFTQNSSVDYSDLNSYYTSFNTFIANYGGSITQLTIPTQGKTVPSDITNLNAKISEFQSDAYLGQESSLWIPATAPNVGDLLQASNWTNITTTINNFSIIKCRNLASNTYSTQTCAPQSCSSEGTCKPRSCSSEGTCKPKSCSSQGSCNPKSCSSQGSCNPKSCSSQGSCNPKSCSSQGTCSKTCSQGTCNNGYYIYLVLTSTDRTGTIHYTNSGVANSTTTSFLACSVSTPCTQGNYMTQQSPMTICNRGSNYEHVMWRMWRVNHGSACSYVLCGYSSNGVSCSYSSNGNSSCNNGSNGNSSCNNGSNGNSSCNNGSNGNSSCTYSTNGNSSCTYSTNGNANCTYGTTTCTAKGTTYDLRNTKTAMSKT